MRIRVAPRSDAIEKYEMHPTAITTIAIFDRRDVTPEESERTLHQRNLLTRSNEYKPTANLHPAIAMRERPN